MIKQPPNAINERLYHNSLIETVFNSAKAKYKYIRKKSNYKTSLKHTTNMTTRSNKNQQKKNNTIHVNPHPTKVPKNALMIVGYLLDKRQTFSRSKIYVKIVKKLK